LDPTLPDQMQQRLLGWNVKQLFQFRGKVASRSLIDKGFRCDGAQIIRPSF